MIFRWFRQINETLFQLNYFLLENRNAVAIKQSALTKRNNIE